MFLFLFIIVYLLFLYVVNDCLSHSYSFNNETEKLQYRFIQDFSKFNFSSNGYLIFKNASTDVTKTIENHSTASIYSDDFISLTKYLKNKNGKKMFMFTIKPYAGVANNIRSIRGIIMLAIVNNASFCTYYSDFFTIMNDSFAFLECPSNIVLPKWKHDQAVGWAINSGCNYHINYSLEIQTSDDIAWRFFECNDFMKDISVIDRINSMGSITNFVSRYLFKPKKYITDYGDSVLSQMKGVKVGIQLRFGGNTAASQEKEHFLSPAYINFYIYQIAYILSLVKSNYTLFLSTDSPSIKHYLSSLNATIYTASKYPVGHTNQRQLQFLQRAITDIYILSRCDVLLHTQGSSYGSLASAISISKLDYTIQRKP